MFNFIKNKFNNVVSNTSNSMKNNIDKIKKSVPSIPNVPKITLPPTPKITIGDFKTLGKQQLDNFKQVKLSTVTMPMTTATKLILKSTSQTSWFLIKLFFRTRLGNVIKWTTGISSLSFLGYVYGTTETHDVIVEKVYHKSTIKGTTKLIVIVKGGEVYNVENSIMWGQLNADGLFAKIKPENKYIFRTYGIELQQIGLHKKIVHVVEEK